MSRALEIFARHSSPEVLDELFVYARELEARVALLEAQIATPKQQHYSDSVTIEMPTRDAGPTALRGRVTRRDE